MDFDPNNTSQAQGVMNPPVQADPAQVGGAPTGATQPSVASQTTPQQAADQTPVQTHASPAGKEGVDHAKELRNAIIAGNIPQIVMYGISYALHLGASDLHIEPEEGTIRVRFRVDGVLRHIVEYPLNIHPAVVSRIKIMSNMKIDEQRIPQDGRTQVTTEDGREIDLRVSSLPTVNGEKMVMRLQDKTTTIPDLPALGLSGTLLKKMEAFTKIPNGILLVTGPTGSGKTNTLYSVLHRLNQVGVNIITFEDPVEYQMDGLNQSQIRPDIDYNFAFGLRTALRQDPDVIMVGEIRDQETIEIAVRAALTGHLVLSTLHTNSAVGTLTRVMDMGIKSFLINSSVRGIVSQRLVRRICEHCKVAYVPQPDELTHLKEELATVSAEDLDPALLTAGQLYRGQGCAQCGDLGYKGRVGIFEILPMTPGLASLVLKEASDVDLLEQAKKEGMLTLKQDGLIKALKGITTLEEVFRVVQ